MTDRPDVETLEVATRKVLMSPELMAEWATRDMEGNRVVWDWTELREGGLYAGFWEPTLTVDRTDNLAAALFTRVVELETALEETYGLAMSANEGDPWYAAHDGLDADAILGRARALLEGSSR